VSGRVAEFRSLDIEPYAIHPEDALSAPVFLKSLDLPFPVLVDRDRAVATAYGALAEDGSRVARTTVLIGKNGRIVYRATGSPAPDEILSILREGSGRDEITPV